jgi:Ca2+-binding EF-hand superfamily protein
MKKIFKVMPLILVPFLSVISLSTLSVELPVHGPITFAIYDSNGDGFISEQEFNQVRSDRMATKTAQSVAMKKAVKGQSYSIEPGRIKADGMSKGRNIASFTKFDLNGDGVILKQEFYDARAARKKVGIKQGYPMRTLANAPSFEDVDSDGNGEILSEEFAQYHVNRQQKIMQK